jgi:acetoacetyl-CoA synthetase
LADLLFTEIAFGRQLPLAAIGYAPTIAALAALLEEPSLPARSPFIQMKPGSEKPPIFIVHGLGGRTAEFYDLVRRIQTEHPIYGIQAKRIDGFEKPLERVEDMARSYLAALQGT